MQTATISIHTDTLRDRAASLRAGDRVLLTGTVYTVRDAAHQKICELLDQKLPLPFPLAGSAIYYAGPTPPRHGMAVGSCGPTTAGRMDPFTPRLISLGLSATIGKGNRSLAVQEAMRQHQACYFCAVGGAGALIARRIEQAEEIAFPELGCESIKRLTVKNFPLIVAIDSLGNNLFQPGQSQG